MGFLNGRVLYKLKATHHASFHGTDREHEDKDWQDQVKTNKKTAKLHKPASNYRD